MLHVVVDARDFLPEWERRWSKAGDKIAVIIGAEIARRLKSYPRRRHDIHVKFKTDRQRRWWFWALKHHAVQFPYIRTGHLMHSWKVGKARWGRVLVYNRRHYAPYVQDKERQSWYHRQVPWQTVQDVVRKYRESGRGEKIAKAMLIMEERKASGRR